MNPLWWVPGSATAALSKAEETHGRKNQLSKLLDDASVFLTDHDRSPEWFDG